nr:PREDICTED: mitochondrial ornithine transporter 1 [Bemisia tabaci]
MHDSGLSTRHGAGSSDSSGNDVSNSSEARKHSETRIHAVNFLAGTIGGAATVLVGQPLDTVKVKMQTSPTEFKGMTDCLKKIYRFEGLRGLYAGSMPAVTANVAENSVLFLCYGAVQRSVAYCCGYKTTEELGIFGNGMAGCFASFFSSFTLCPTELIKVRLQAAQETKASNKSSQNVKINGFTLTRQIYREEGFKGFFRGIGSTIAREMPGYFFFFAGYEGTRLLLAPPGRPKEECGPLGTIVAGAVGGLSLWTVIYPFDLVKSRTQVQTTATKNFVLVMIDIIKAEGVQALYSGLRPCLVRTIPASAALFLAVEYTKKFLLPS